MSTPESATVSRNRLANFSFAHDFSANIKPTVTPNNPLRGRVAIVSGGASGISRAVGIELAQRGAAVAVVHHGQPHQAETLTEVVRSFGSKALAIDTNTADEIACAEMVAEVFDQLGVADILVHFPDFKSDTPIHLLHRKDWDHVVNEGLGSAYNLTRALINPMRQHGGGRLIFVVEIPGRQHSRQFGHVMTGESAVAGLAKALAMENAARGITVNCVSTGYFEHGLTSVLNKNEVDRMAESVPAARLGRPEEAARMVAFLASDDAAYITGQTIAVDGGLSIH